MRLTPVHQYVIILRYISYVLVARIQWLYSILSQNFTTAQLKMTEVLLPQGIYNLVSFVLIVLLEYSVDA